MKYAALFLILLMCELKAATVYKYRVYCVTEAANIYTWSENEPTKCPNDTSHTINANSISIVDQIATNEVTIQQETTPTGGNFRAETFKVVANQQGQNVAQISWPFNISLLQVDFVTTNDNQGDLLTIEIPSEVIVGTITQDINSSDTVIHVSLSVINVVAIGYYITITDGVNTDNVGRILMVDTVNNTITVEVGSTHAYQASSPTYTAMTISPLHDFELGPPQSYSIGQSSLRAFSIPANIPMVARYFNKDSTSKTLVFNYEYLY